MSEGNQNRTVGAPASIAKKNGGDAAKEPGKQTLCFIVPVQIMAAALDLMQEELPMKKARNIVQALEQCPKQEVVLNQNG
ncbi:MAG: hypothetical protein GY896_23055 [Gammaproteobacteria bacterium]|nr:hypothetical protein [Gammaproteobacteria bacterium]